MRTGILEIPSDVKALPIEKLGELLASALYDIENGDDEEGVLWACTALDFDREIQQALELGQLRRLSCVTGRPTTFATAGDVVKVEELLDLLADDVRIALRLVQPSSTGSGTLKKTTPAQEAEIVQLFNRGHGISVRQLAQQFDVTRPVIDRVLRDAGVKK